VSDPTDAPAEPAGLRPPAPAAARNASIDVLRGIVMVIMALDHARDFVSGAEFDPTDPAHTTPLYFFTRWITHYCAPTFFFLAGVAAFLAGRRKTRAQLSWWLASRGLWLVVIELTIVRLAWSFDLGSPYRFLVIWALGVSMIVLAALIHLPRWAIAAISVLAIAGHNLLDGVAAAPLVGAHGVSLHASAFDWLWAFLHVLDYPVVYPIVPWFAVMAAGYAFGPLLDGTSAARARRLTWLGGGLALGFVALRLTNLYGDPSPWEGPHVVMSVLNVSKYPPSLLYLLMTLAPAIAALPWLERLAPTRIGRWFAVFGRVPLFFYVLHLYAAHVLALLLTYAVTGTFWVTGFDLWVVYAVWLAIVAGLYPLCRWFAALKARRRDWWLSYL